MTNLPPTSSPLVPVPPAGVGGPTLAGTLRGVGLAAAVAAIGAIVSAASTVNLGPYEWIAPGAVLLLRSLEGAIDTYLARRPAPSAPGGPVVSPAPPTGS